MRAFGVVRAREWRRVLQWDFVRVGLKVVDMLVVWISLMLWMGSDWYGFVVDGRAWGWQMICYRF